MSRLSGPALLAGARLNLVPAATAMLAAPFSLRWACIGLLPLLGLVLAAMRRQRFRAAEHGLALLLLVPLAADLLAFTVTGSEVRWHLAVALDRLWLQVAPLMILIAGGQAGRLAAAQPE